MIDKRSYVIAVLILAIAVLLAGCTRSDSGPAQTAGPYVSEPAPAPVVTDDAKSPAPTEESDITEEPAAVETKTEEPSVEEDNDKETGENKMKLQIGEHILSATLADNSSAEALMDLLRQGSITVSMRDYANMEKVGSLGTGLPTNNEQITTEPGDIILYQGSALVIYYAPNSWNFTRLGKIDDVTRQELMDILGEGDVDVTLSID